MYITWGWKINMIVSELKLYNFRKFKSEGNKPGLYITFHKGLNALIGENDSGKTAIIDALKLVLLTQSNEYIRPVEEDFYSPSQGEPSDEFRIECILSDFTMNEAKNFIEYLTFDNTEGKVKYFLKLNYKAWKERNKIYQELKAGDSEDGVSLDVKARELLKAVYLKPLRDAEREMSSGRSSRISQILLSHSIFKDKENHDFIGILDRANDEIKRYFTEKEGKQILETVCSNLEKFNGVETDGSATIKTSDIKLKAILESLSLDVTEINPGLGELNLLFIAAELLLLKDEVDGGIKLALIEELEAHLHPQAQLRLISFLQNEYMEHDVQTIITTHSPVLASKINLKNMILIKDGRGYDMNYGKTELDKKDYLFLQRFLDSTKANLFFAKGVIMVEGDAENLLIPVIADIIDCPLEKYGVSIVNVGSTAFLHYSRILIRKDAEDKMEIPVSVITDCDIKPYEENGNPIKPETIGEAIKNKNGNYDKEPVKSFVSPAWTLEYCLARSFLSEKMHRAIRYAKKIKNSIGSISLTEDKIKQVDNEIEEDIADWEHNSNYDKAYKIFELMLDKSGKSDLKSITAQCLANMLRWEISNKPEGITDDKMFDYDLYGFTVNKDKKAVLKNQFENDENLKYIVDAIKYACGLQKEETENE